MIFFDSVRSAQCDCTDGRRLYLCSASAIAQSTKGYGSKLLANDHLLFGIASKSNGEILTQE
jgi:hypothetical protein